MEYNDSTIIDIKTSPKTHSAKSMIQKRWFSRIKLTTAIIRLPNALFWLIKRAGKIKYLESKLSYNGLTVSIFDSIFCFYNFKWGCHKYKNRFGSRTGLEELIEENEITVDNIKVKDTIISGGISHISDKVDNELIIYKTLSEDYEQKWYYHVDFSNLDLLWANALLEENKKYRLISNRRLITHSKIIKALNEATQEKQSNQKGEYEFDDDERDDLKNKIESTLNLRHSFKKLFVSALENSIAIGLMGFNAYIWWCIAIFEAECCSDWGLEESLMLISAVSNTASILNEGIDIVSDFIFRSKERFFTPAKKEIEKPAESSRLLSNDIIIN